MNYGLVSAVLLNKIALFNLNTLQERTGTPVFPIIGVGSAPFRGNLSRIPWTGSAPSILRHIPSPSSPHSSMTIRWMRCGLQSGSLNSARFRTGGH